MWVIGKIDAWLGQWVPKWPIFRQVIAEFWVATALAVAVSIFKHFVYGGDFIALFTGSFIFFYFYTAAFVRISRQQTQENMLRSLLEQAGDTNRTLTTMAKDVIAIAEREKGNQGVQLLLRDIATATLQANSQFNNISSAIKDFSPENLGRGTDYYQFVARLTPEQEKQLRAISNSAKEPDK
jgi:hypothetical protein